MSYDTIATVSQVTSLLMFMALFAAVVAYALWPGNKARFDAAQVRALELDTPGGVVKPPAIKTKGPNSPTAKPVEGAPQ